MPVFRRVEDEVGRSKTTIALESGEVARAVEPLIDVVPESHDRAARVDHSLELAQRDHCEARSVAKRVEKTGVTLVGEGALRQRKKQAPQLHGSRTLAPSWSGRSCADTGRRATHRLTEDRRRLKNLAARTSRPRRRRRSIILCPAGLLSLSTATVSHARKPHVRSRDPRSRRRVQPSTTCRLHDRADAIAGIVGHRRQRIRRRDVPVCACARTTLSLDRRDGIRCDGCCRAGSSYRPCVSRRSRTPSGCSRRPCQARCRCVVR